MNCVGPGWNVMGLRSEVNSSQPETYLITPDWPVEWLQDYLHWALEEGVELIQLRCLSLPLVDVEKLVGWLKEQSMEVGILLNSGIPDAMGLAEKYSCGIHWRSRDLTNIGVDIPALEGPYAASCHDLRELKAAERAGVDFAVLSPVCQTRSHPDAQPIGWNRFSEWVRGSEIPVYALGGMHFEDILRAKGAGAAGVAGIGLFVQRYASLSESRSSSSILSGGTGIE